MTITTFYYSAPLKDETQSEVISCSDLTFLFHFCPYYCQVTPLTLTIVSGNHLRADIVQKNAVINNVQNVV